MTLTPSYFSSMTMVDHLAICASSSSASIRDGSGTRGLPTALLISLAPIPILTLLVSTLASILRCSYERGDLLTRSCASLRNWSLAAGAVNSLPVRSFSVGKGSVGRSFDDSWSTSILFNFVVRKGSNEILMISSISGERFSLMRSCLTFWEPPPVSPSISISRLSSLFISQIYDIIS